MTLTVNSIIPVDSCDTIGNLYLQFFRTNCTKFLRKIDSPPATSFKNKLLLSSRKQLYIDKFKELGIQVCQQPTFCLKNKLTKIRIRRQLLCPWFDHRRMKLKIIVQYSEAINPTDPHDAHDKVYEVTWTHNGPPAIFESSFTSLLVLDPIEGYPNSGGPSQAKIKIQEIFEDVEDTCEIPIIDLTFTLEDNAGYDFLAATPVVQDRQHGCPNSGTSGDTGFINEQTGLGPFVTVFWTMVGPFIGPIAIVRSLLIMIKPDGWDDSGIP